MKAKEIVGKVLMAFVLVSIGFAVGKEMTFRAIAQNNGDPKQSVAAAGENTGEPAQDKVIVYYMHATFRCFSCNTIETMANAVVENDFADALADGRIEWRTVNFNENVAMAQRYGVSAPTVVLVKMRGDEHIDANRLDEVWTKNNNPEAFKQYIKENIDAYLDGGQV